MTRTPASEGEGQVPWIDHGVVPPRRLPTAPDEIAAYLTEALGHAVYERWTWSRLVSVYGALPDARRAKPGVCRLLIDTPQVVEAWQRGRLHALPAHEAPGIDAVVQALLKVHAKRFRRATSSTPSSGLTATPSDDTLSLVLPRSLQAWLQRRGRLANPHADTNTLGAIDDHAAVAAFLRERAARSRHTWRAYTAELQRLCRWCLAHGRGPLSDLTRQDLLAYQQWLAQSVIASSTGAGEVSDTVQLSSRSQARALAVAASLFRYWHDTGYLLGNPAAGLSGGARARAGFAPKRFVPPGAAALPRLDGRARRLDAAGARQR